MLMDVSFWLSLACVGLIAIGLYGMLLSGHLLRMVFGLGLVEAGVTLFLVKAGFKLGSVAPILVQQTSQNAALQELTMHNMVDPVPQAMVLTAIVIGAGIQALALALVIKIYQCYGTLNSREVFQAMEAERETELQVQQNNTGQKLTQRENP